MSHTAIRCPITKMNMAMRRRELSLVMAQRVERCKEKTTVKTKEESTAVETGRVKRCKLQMMLTAISSSAILSAVNSQVSQRRLSPNLRAVPVSNQELLKAVSSHRCKTDSSRQVMRSKAVQKSLMASRALLTCCQKSIKSTAKLPMALRSCSTLVVTCHTPERRSPRPPRTHRSTLSPMRRRRLPRL